MNCIVIFVCCIYLDIINVDLKIINSYAWAQVKAHPGALGTIMTISGHVRDMFRTQSTCPGTRPGTFTRVRDMSKMDNMCF